MSEKEARALARRIVADLFTNGAGERAARLVLELPGGANGGGWSERGAAYRIARTLMEADATPPKAKSRPKKRQAVR